MPAPDRTERTKKLRVESSRVLSVPFAFYRLAVSILTFRVSGTRAIPLPCCFSSSFHFARIFLRTADGHPAIREHRPNRSRTVASFESRRTSRGRNDRFLERIGSRCSGNDRPLGRLIFRSRGSRDASELPTFETNGPTLPSWNARSTDTYVATPAPLVPGQGILSGEKSDTDGRPRDRDKNPSTPVRAGAGRDDARRDRASGTPSTIYTAVDVTRSTLQNPSSRCRDLEPTTFATRDARRATRLCFSIRRRLRARYSKLETRNSKLERVAFPIANSEWTVSRQFRPEGIRSNGDRVSKPKTISELCRKQRYERRVRMRTSFSSSSPPPDVEIPSRANCDFASRGYGRYERWFGYGEPKTVEKTGRP